MMKNKYILMLVICIVLFMSFSCNIPSDNGDDNNKTFTVKYLLNDEIYYQTSANENENVRTLEFIHDYHGITGNNLNILEVNWYDGNILVDEEYQVNKDVTLVGSIQTIYTCIKDFIIKNITYTATSSITIPNKCYTITTDEFGNQKLVDRTCKIYDTYYQKIWNSSVNESPKGDHNILDGVAVKELTVYAESFLYGISAYTFADNENIEKITIIGTIRQVRDYAFYNLINLKQIIVYGTYWPGNGNPIENCNDVVIEDNLDRFYEEIGL